MRRKFNIFYIGKSPRIAEYIYFQEALNLKYIVCEKNQITDEFLTFSLVRNIPIIPVTSKKDLLDLELKGMDFYIMGVFGLKIPQEFIAKIEGYNIHFGYLPYYKGRHATSWATYNNEKYQGITLHKVTPEIDSGEIISRKTVPYYFWENETHIIEKLTKQVPMLIEDLVQYRNGQIIPIPNVRDRYYYGKVKENDYLLNLEKDTPANIYNKVRAQVKFKGAKLFFQGKIYWIKRIIFTRNPEKYSTFVSIPYRGYYLILLNYKCDE